MPNLAQYQRGWGRQKPPPGTKVDGGHPLARGLGNAWLFSERGGTQIFDVLGKAKGTLNAGSVTNGWSPSPLGLTPNMAGGVGGQYVSAPLISSLAKGVSFGFWGVPKAASQLGRVFFNGSAGNNGWGLYHHNGSGSAGTKLTVLTDGVSFDATTSTVAPALNVPLFAVATCTAANVWALYQNGVSNSSGSSTAIAPTVGCGLGGSSTGGDSWNGALALAFFYTRVLAAAEVLWLYQEPYSFMVQPAPRRAFFGPAAPTSRVSWDLSHTPQHQAVLAQ